MGQGDPDAIELYFSYLLAKKYQKVWINNEPYYWLSRYCQYLNNEGIHHHVNSPLFFLDQNLKQKKVGKHENYLKQISNSYNIMITKFIRGNGRINFIDNVMKPDYNIIIIRNLFDVLNSIKKMNWDFLGKGLVHPNDWNRLMKEINEKKLMSREKKYINIKDDLDKNVIYWYIMNKFVLENKKENYIFINYDNIEKAENIAKKIGLLNRSKDLKIKNRIFKGNKIIGDSILTSENNKNTLFSALHNKLINNFKLYNYYYLHNFGLEVGNLARINKKYNFNNYNKNQGNKDKANNFKDKKMYHYLNNIIMKKLNNIS